MIRRDGVWKAILGGLVTVLIAVPATGQLVASRELGATGRDLPWEMMIAQSDLVAVGTVSEAPPAPTTSPEDPAGVVADRQPKEIKMKLEKVLGGSAKEGMKGKEIGVLASSTPGMVSTVLKVGDRYLVFLRKPVGEKELWTAVPQLLAMTVADEDVIKTVSERCDIEKWNWGKESNGLRMVALPLESRTIDGGSAAVQVVVGVRNVGKDPICLNTFPTDRVLTLKATWDGTPVGSRPFAPAARSSMVFDPAAHTAQIKPGEIAWISPLGKQVARSLYIVEVPAGACEVRVVYKSSRVAELASGEKAWVGSVESAPTKVEVTRPEP